MSFNAGGADLQHAAIEPFGSGSCSGVICTGAVPWLINTGNSSCFR